MTRIRFSYNRQSRHVLHRRQILFCKLILTMLVVGCIRVEPTPFPTWELPGEYVTAHQAYAHISLAAQEWSDEFVVTSIWVAWHPVLEQRAQPDGTADSWTFKLSSTTEWTRWGYLANGSVRNEGCTDHVAYKCNHREPLSIDELKQKAIPMDKIIGSDEAAVIVQGLSIPAAVQLYALAGSKIVSTQDVRQFAWNFLFQMPDDVCKSVSVDMLTGEVIYNEFAQVTP